MANTFTFCLSVYLHDRTKVTDLTNVELDAFFV